MDRGPGTTLEPPHLEIRDAQPHLRAADTDRAAVAAVLGEHMSAGRLTLDEFDERLTRAYAARTFGELEELTADLPPSAPSRARGTGARQPAAGDRVRHGRLGSDTDANSWRSWLTTALIVIGVWATISLASWELPTSGRSGSSAPGAPCCWRRRSWAAAGRDERRQLGTLTATTHTARHEGRAGTSGAGRSGGQGGT